MSQDDELSELKATVSALQSRVEKLELQLEQSIRDQAHLDSSAIGQNTNSLAAVKMDSASIIPCESFVHISEPNSAKISRNDSQPIVENLPDPVVENSLAQVRNHSHTDESVESLSLSVSANPQQATSSVTLPSPVDAEAVELSSASPVTFRQDLIINSPGDSLITQVETEHATEPQKRNAKNGPPPLSSVRADSLETKIGLYWLSKLGMAFVVLGVALLIGYSFQYFGPIAKVSTGFVIAAFLVLAGEFFDRKQNLAGFGQVLCGGGWSVAYFTSYAMHHIESVRLIHDPIYGAVLMTAVALCAAYHSFKKNAELVASLAVCLGYLSLSLSNLNIFSALASTVLTAVLAFMVVKKKWATLYSSGLLSALFILFFSIDPQLALSRTADIALYMTFLAPYVLAAGFLPTILREDTALARSGAASVNVVAASVSLLCLMHAFSKLSLPIDSNALAFGIVTLTYAIFALFARQRGCPDNALTNSLISLSSLTLFMPAINGNQPTLAAWALELGLLIYVGMKYQLRSFRFFSLLLASVLCIACIVECFSTATVSAVGITIPRALPRVLPATLVMAVACYLFQSPFAKKVPNLSERESKLSFYWYGHCAGALAWLSVPALVHFGKLIQGDNAHRVVTFCWTLEAFGLGFLGLKWSRPYFSIVALLGFLLVGFCWLLPGAHHFLNWALLLTGMFYLAFQFRLQKDKVSQFIYRSYFLLAALFMLYVPPPASGELTAAIWSAELLACAYLSFRWSDSFFRNITTCGAFLVFARAIFESSNAWLSISVASMALIAAAYFARRAEPAILGPDKHSPAPSLMNVGASVVLASFVGNHLQSSLVSVGWAVEGVLLLALGFATKDKVLRICGLLSFALVVLRLLFVDLSGANTIYRIVAFIAAGVLFMLAAYAYAWFNKKFEERIAVDS